MKLDNYRQQVEGELWAMCAAIVFLGVMIAGFTWALVFIVRWWLV